MGEYLHSHGYIFRNLKPENVLIAGDGYVKIRDFRFARSLPIGAKAYTMTGTPEYIAPEILTNKGHDRYADWWAVGIINYEMLVGEPPFVDEDVMGIYQKIL